MPPGADFENVVNEDEAELCVEGFSQHLKKDLVWGPKKSDETGVTRSKGVQVRDEATIFHRIEG